MKLNEIFSIDEVEIDNEEGLGATGYNRNVDYRGLRVKMRPSVFLKLAQKLDVYPSVDSIAKYIKNGGAIGSPFLLVDIPEEWWETDADFTKEARVIGHEGRNRMAAILQTEGDAPIEVHLFFYSVIEVRARHLNPRIIENLRKWMLSQNGNWVSGPLFLLHRNG